MKGYGKIFVKFLLVISILTIVVGSNVVLASEPSIQTSFSVNPEIITPGSDGYIQLIVKNSGTGTANSIKISSGYQGDEIDKSGSWMINIGTLAPGGSTEVPFKFSIPKKTHPGMYTMNFYIEYHDDSTLKRVTQKAIITVQARETLELNSINPNTFYPGETTTLVFELENKGEDEITDIVLTWQSPDDLILPLGSDNRLSISSIDSGQKIEAKVDIVVSSTVTPGVYPLTIETKYYDRAGLKQNSTSQSGIVIDSVTDFDVVMQDSTETTTTLAVANTGKNTAYSTIVKIPKQEGFMVSGSSAATIGNLDAGDYTLATFQLVSKTNATIGVKDLTVEVSYTDDFGERKTVKKEVDLGSTAIKGAIGERTMPQQGQASDISSNGLLYIGIGIAGIIGVVGVLRLLRRGGKGEKH